MTTERADTPLPRLWSSEQSATKRNPRLPMLDMPDYVKVYAETTGKEVALRWVMRDYETGNVAQSAVNRLTGGEQAWCARRRRTTRTFPDTVCWSEVPEDDSAEWFLDCVEGLLVQDGLQTIDFTKSGSLIFVELYPWAKGTGPTPAAALLAAVLAMMEGEK